MENANEGNIFPEVIMCAFLYNLYRYTYTYIYIRQVKIYILLASLLNRLFRREIILI